MGKVMETSPEIFNHFKPSPFETVTTSPPEFKCNYCEYNDFIAGPFSTNMTLFFKDSEYSLFHVMTVWVFVENFHLLVFTKVTLKVDIVHGFY